MMNAYRFTVKALAPEVYSWRCSCGMTGSTSDHLRVVDAATDHGLRAHFLVPSASRRRLSEDQNQ